MEIDQFTVFLPVLCAFPCMPFPKPLSVRSSHRAGHKHQPVSGPGTKVSPKHEVSLWQQSFQKSHIKTDGHHHSNGPAGNVLPLHSCASQRWKERTTKSAHRHSLSSPPNTLRLRFLNEIPPNSLLVWMNRAILDWSLWPSKNFPGNFKQR